MNLRNALLASGAALTLGACATTGPGYGNNGYGNNGNGGMRQKLENSPGISWQNPKNLGDGKRVMVGIVKSSNEGEVAASFEYDVK